MDEETPEEIMISRENVIGMHERIKERLSKFEYQVLELYLKGYDYTQIAEKLGKQPKAIDNALQRIRSKVREVCSGDGKTTEKITANCQKCRKICEQIKIFKFVEKTVDNSL